MYVDCSDTPLIAKITTVNVPRITGGMYGSGGTSDTRAVNNGLLDTRGPRRANPPN